jgi:hypothetical protein
MYSPPCSIETPLLSLIYLNFVFYHEFFSIIIFNMVTDYHLICSLILKFNNYMMNLDYNFFSACFLVVHSKGELASMEMRNRRLTTSKATEYKCYPNVDLTLKLAQPKKNSNNLENAPRFSTPMPSYMSSILGFDLGGTSKDELPSKILMGCTNCLMHMVDFTSNPKCPMCKKHALIGAKFQENPAKRIRRE